MPGTDASLSIQLTTPLGKDKLIADRLDGTEALNEPFLFSLAATATEDGLDVTTVLGKSVTVTLVDGEGKQRIIDTLAARVAVQGRRWMLELRPWLWMLTLTTDNRIFQNKTAVEIIKAVFDGAGYSDYKDSTTGTYTAREYCVQYNETSFAFVCRLMEEEGIWYFFEHTAGTHTLVLADDSSAHAACPQVAAAKFLELPAEKGWLENNRVEAVTMTQAVTVGKYQADDYNFTTPSTELKVNAAGQGAFQIYDYPGLYDTKDAGSGFANKRLQAFEAVAKVMSGTADVRHFTSGYKFTLSNHPDASLNADWALLSVSHSAQPNQYENAFTAFPADTVFRPGRLTAKPRIAGTQTAVVVGKSGEEIWTDQYGRIKVQFHWDQLGTKDENSSCWIRVAQPWAGKSWGGVDAAPHRPGGGGQLPRRRPRPAAGDRHRLQRREQPALRAARRADQDHAEIQFVQGRRRLQRDPLRGQGGFGGNLRPCPQGHEHRSGKGQSRRHHNGRRRQPDRVQGQPDHHHLQRQSHHYGDGGQRDPRGAKGDALRHGEGQRNPYQQCRFHP
ncbi:MAG: type VI secretion system tip protein VgrG [Magnetospirillum sp.]|nr:type VI secretion system tip protein VgrG [Magnetospirillum sp.]